MDPICLLSCALRLRTKYQFGKGIITHRAGTRYKQAELDTLSNLCFPLTNLKSQTVEPDPNLTVTPGLAMTVVSISRYELLHSRTNLHIRVEPISTALIRLGGNTQDCILVVRPFGRAFPEHHTLPALGPAEGGEAETYPMADCWQNNTAHLALAHCIPSPHMSPLLEGFIAWTPQDLFSIYGEKNEGEKWHREGFQRGLQA